MKVVNCCQCGGNHNIRLIGWEYKCNTTGKNVNLKEDMLSYYKEEKEVLKVG